MKLPLTLGKVLFEIAQFINRFIPVLNQPRTRVAVVLNDHEVLLVKNWLGSQQWTLPGGGIKRGETPLQCAVRELFEETGLVVEPSELSFVGYMTNTGLPRAVMVYRINLNDSDSAATIPDSARHEITHLAWHPLTNLPLDRLNLVDQALSREPQG